MSFAEIVCAKCDLINKLTSCSNCGSEDLTISNNEETKKIEKVACGKCANSFSKIKCERCSADVYLVTAKTKSKSFFDWLFGYKETPQGVAEENLFIWLLLALAALFIRWILI